MVLCYHPLIILLLLSNKPSPKLSGLKQQLFYLAPCSVGAWEAPLGLGKGRWSSLGSFRCPWSRQGAWSLVDLGQHHWHVWLSAVWKQETLEFPQYGPSWSGLCQLVSRKTRAWSQGYLLWNPIWSLVRFMDTGRIFSMCLAFLMCEIGRVIVKSTDSRISLHHLLSLWIWANYFTCRYLRFLIKWW